MMMANGLKASFMSSENCVNYMFYSTLLSMKATMRIKKAPKYL